MAPKRATRTEVNGTTSVRVAKRVASPEPTHAPSKRTKKGDVATRTPKTTATKPVPKTNGAATHSKAPKIVNKLPVPPAHGLPPNQIFAWGAGNFGQFGMGPNNSGEFDKPKKNPWVEKKIEDGGFGDERAGIEAIAAGGMHTMFIDEKGTIWTCGVNDDAALGRITKDVPDPANEDNYLNAEILTSIPHPLQTLVNEGFRAVSIAAGDSISAAVSTTGELRVWGSFRANEGSLGFSSGSKHQWLPAPILHLPTRYGEKVASVSAGNNHLVVLTTHGHVYTWGTGEQGQLGRKILERSKIHGTTPEKVTLHLRTRRAVVVGAGNYASFAVDDEGDVWGWGLNSMGQTGTGYGNPEDDQVVPQPRIVEGLGKEDLGGATVVQVAGGEHHTIFLTSDGRVFACGRSNGGQLGLPDDHPALKNNDSGMVPTATLVPFPDTDDPVVHISAGTHNNLAVTAKGALYAWGEGNQGELGIGDETNAKQPTVVVRREGGSWKAISAACGGQHSLGLFRKKVAD
ncbi:RCC1/BLIP-II [Rickenella mellea]|uniref:RCC1/BLIP-II n=1 Tax=Rickenella mellea TaxID=50990 RepID=A0A4V3AZI0_9AGAM|nr:RCC1/BLIP-II [Rickenella mellea]